jgi:uncharacterized protein (DUF2141 family)
MNKVLDIFSIKAFLKAASCLLTGMLLVVLSGCANQLAPGGGGLDTTPPEITEVYPGNGTLNFSEKYIEFTFSEYVDKTTFKDALFISPAIDGNLETSWTNTTVKVRFPKALKANTTYHVTVGTDVVDNHNKNRMAKAYTYVFSTGSKIDNGTITGTVFVDKPSGVMIFGYQVNSDTIDPAKVKPDYISQVGADGNFQLTGLARGKYRIFAVKDEFKDLLFQSDQDMIGVPTKDYTLTETDSLIKGLCFVLQKIDTVKPRLLTAIMTDKYHIFTTFSEDLKYDKLTKLNFSLVDSTTLKSYPATSAFKGRGKQKEYFIGSNAAIPDSDKCFLIAKNFSDEAGNITDIDGISLMVTAKPDTTAPKLIKFEPVQNAVELDFTKPSFVYGFDDAIKFDSLKSAVWLMDTSRNLIPSTFEALDDASFKVVPNRPLESDKNYRVVINLRKLPDYAGNFLDSTFTTGYKTINELDFTGIYGDVENFEGIEHIVLQLVPDGSSEPAYTEIPAKDGKFAFEKIRPGKYRLLCFNDKNNNRILDKGFPYPFVPAESFIYLKDVLNVPARWAVTEVKFDLKELQTK